MLYVRVSEIVACEEEIDGLRGEGGSEWGAGAAALSWLWLTDYQITRVMNQDCRGLWSWHILTHTSTLTGIRQIHTNTHSQKPVRECTCTPKTSRFTVANFNPQMCTCALNSRADTSAWTNTLTCYIIHSLAVNRQSLKLTYAPHCRMYRLQHTHRNAHVRSLLAVCSAHNRHKPRQHEQ